MPLNLHLIRTYRLYRFPHLLYLARPYSLDGTNMAAEGSLDSSLSAFSSFAIVVFMFLSLSMPNRPRRKVRKAGDDVVNSSNMSGTPAAICKPKAANLAPV